MRAFIVVAIACFGLCAGCGSGDDPACLDRYGFVLGSACDDNGDSHLQCPAGAKCSCSGSVTMTDHICFSGQCVTSIAKCDAWCKASASERQSCF